MNKKIIIGLLILIQSIQLNAKTFQEWCEDESITEEQRQTIAILLNYVEVDNCAEGHEKLMARTALNLDTTLIKDVAPIASLPNLIGIGLAGTKVEDITPLLELKNLISLNLTETRVGAGGINTAKALFPNCKIHVDLPSFFEMCVDKLISQEQANTITMLLKKFSLNSCNHAQWKMAKLTKYEPESGDDSISDITPFSSLINLEDLSLNNEQVDIAPLGNLVNLNVLLLNDTGTVDIGPLSSLSRLKTLHLGSNPIEDASPLTSLVSLVSLDLGHTIITDIKPLSGLPNLRWLNLAGTPVSFLDVARLGGKTPWFHVSRLRDQ